MTQLNFWELIGDFKGELKKLLNRAETKVYKVVDLTKFNLIYFRKTDGRKFLVRYVTKQDLILIDTTTGDLLRLTEMKVRTRFRPDKVNNKANRKKRPFINFKRKRAI
jgi:hypothetical protein